MLSVNPLSFLLKRYESYKIGKDKRDKNISHFFFGMSFGELKCACQIIERGKRKHHGNALRINGLKSRKLKKEIHTDIQE